MNSFGSVIFLTVFTVLLLSTRQVDGGKIQWEEEEDTVPNLKDLAKSLKLNNFLALMKFANLSDVLTSKDNYTLFVPIDSAFLALPFSFRQQLIYDSDLAKELLGFHMKKGLNYSSTWRNDMVFDTVAGVKSRINVYNKSTGVVNTLLGKQIDSKNLDQNATNGVINLMKTVVWPVPKKTAADVISAATNLKMFNKAVTGYKGALAKVLKTGTWTVFAPTDEAFKKCPNFVKYYLSWFWQKDALENVLKYHLIQSTQFTAGLESNLTLTTYEGTPMTVYSDTLGTFKVSNGTVNATITKSNIVVTNGVIHLIDLPFASKC